MSPVAPSNREMRTFPGLRRIVATLRGPDGCPWDRVQTHETLRPYIAEEAAETLAAIADGDPAVLCDELGDLLFQVLIHIQLAEEAGDFKMSDVVHSLASKLVRRHPHVFADATASTPDAVVRQWEDLKKEERGHDQPTLAGIPRTLPALAYAQTVQRRAARAGFAWESDEQAWEALDAELNELRSAQAPDERRREAGDAIWALANLLRHLHIDAEDALRLASSSFTHRFHSVESIAAERGVDLRESDIDAKLALWEEAKAAG
jgi:tetrapyrrole methylase family protein / MazG family protein